MSAGPSGRSPLTGFVACAAAVAVSAALLGFDLGARVLTTNDEARFPVMARDILAKGHWLLPETSGAPMLNKPPLHAWLIALGAWPTGIVSQRVAVVPSFVAALGVVATTCLIARRLFGPGVDSGTYDYFTEAIVGKEHSSRGDFQSSEDDNTLVQGVSADRSALGFFGYAYYEENKSKLKLLGIDDGKDENGKGCIKPSREAVEKGQYQPLARPLFIYVKKQAADRPEVQKFVAFYLEKGATLAAEVGYIALPGDAYKLAKKRFDGRVVGSLFGGQGSQVGVTIVDLLKKEQ